MNLLDIFFTALLGAGCVILLGFIVSELINRSKDKRTELMKSVAKEELAKKQIIELQAKKLQEEMCKKSKKKTLEIDTDYDTGLSVLREVDRILSTNKCVNELEISVQLSVTRIPNVEYKANNNITIRK